MRHHLTLVILFAAACGGKPPPAAAPTPAPTTAAPTAAPAPLVELVAFTIDDGTGPWISVAADGTVTHTAKDGTQRAVARLEPEGRVVSPDGAVLVTLAGDGAVAIEGKTVGTLDDRGVLRPRAKPGEVSFGPDGAIIGGVDKKPPRVTPSNVPAVNRAAMLVFIAATVPRERKPAAP